jgi:hypothetical protein
MHRSKQHIYSMNSAARTTVNFDGWRQRLIEGNGVPFIGQCSPRVVPSAGVASRSQMNKRALRV